MGSYTSEHFVIALGLSVFDTRLFTERLWVIPGHVQLQHIPLARRRPDA